MLNFDPAKLLVIIVLALVVMGPERLPNFARQLARVWRTVAGYREQAEAEIRKAMPDLDLPRISNNPSAMVSGFLTELVNPPSKNTEVTSSGDIDRQSDAVPTDEFRSDRAAVESSELLARRTHLYRTSLSQPGGEDPNMN